MSGLRKVLLYAGFAAGAGVVTLAACQSYEFEEVRPKAIKAVNDHRIIEGKQDPPKVMLLVDKSGSMRWPAGQESSLSCTTDGTRDTDYDVNSPHPCRWKDLEKAFGDPTTGFLARSKDIGHFGLAILPAQNLKTSCDAGEVLIGIPDTKGGANDEIRRLLVDVIQPGGGTPIVPTLDVIEQDTKFMAKEEGRARYILLLTDGLPNCNSANATRCSACRTAPVDPVLRAEACKGEGKCYPGEAAGDDKLQCYSDPFDGAYCYDGDNLATKIASLYAQGVKTFVIGFGSETKTEGLGILNAAAVAGGEPLSGDIKYYQANSEAELSAVLERIRRKLQQCDFNLDPPPQNENLLVVMLYDTKTQEEVTLERGKEWQYGTKDGTNEIDMSRVSVLDERCTLLQTAEPERYQLRFLYARDL